MFHGLLYKGHSVGTDQVICGQPMLSIGLTEIFPMRVCSYTCREFSAELAAV